MVDPLAEVVTLLKPGAPFSKLVTASAPWAVSRTEVGRPVYLVVLQGSCHLRIDSEGRSDTITLHEGGFALIPSARTFATSSLDRQPPVVNEVVDTTITPVPGGVHVGDPCRPAETRLLVGSCVFASPDAVLLTSLLPDWVHVRDGPRLSMLVQLVNDESRSSRPARDIVMARLLEVVLIEALRSRDGASSSPGLLRGLSDPKLAQALRMMHERTSESWTMAQLAREAAMSRSAFFARFNEAVGMAPMEYLLAWRMALAKQLLQQRDTKIADVAARVGYSSVNTFGVAFARHVGVPPGRYAKEEMGSTTV